MKSRIIPLATVLGLLAVQRVTAQGTLYISNLSESSSGSAVVGSDSWCAVYFRTGTNSGGYNLDSVQLLMAPAIGSASGFTVLLYSYSNRFPATSLGILSGSDSVAGGVFSYSNPGLTLAPATAYCIVATSSTLKEQGSYKWNIANTSSYTSIAGWELGFLDSGHGYSFFTDGTGWVYSGSGVASPQFAVYATAIPEPTPSELVGLSLVGFSFWRRKRRRAK